MATVTKIVETDLKEDAGFNMADQKELPNEIGMCESLFVHIIVCSIFILAFLLLLLIYSLTTTPSCIDC